FMDEPFQGVDAKSQQAIVAVLHALREQGKTVVIVHHDLVTVRESCDHGTLLNQRVVSSGPAAESFTKENIRTAYDVAADDGSFLEFVSRACSSSSPTRPTGWCSPARSPSGSSQVPSAASPTCGNSR